MADKAVKLGLIGAGAAVWKLHMPALAKLRDKVELASVWSRSSERAQTMATELGIRRTFTDYRELLADPTIEAVLIAVPIELNARVAIDAIHAGKHVLAEKPIAANLAEARQVLEACDSTDRVVAIAENFRYRDDILEAKRLIKSGVIGEVQSFRMTSVFDLQHDVRRDYIEQPWRKEPQHAGGLVVDAGVHAVAGIREVLGDIDQVYARLQDNSAAIAGPDSLVMQLDLTSGAPGQYLACYTAKTDRETVFDLAVYGTAGSLWLSEGAVNWFSAATANRSSWKAPSHDRGYLGQWRNFLAAVRVRESVYSTPQKAYGDLLVLDCALHSANSRQPVSVPTVREP
jgi:predicted dehydrogenase